MEQLDFSISENSVVCPHTPANLHHRSLAPPAGASRRLAGENQTARGTAQCWVRAAPTVLRTALSTVDPAALLAFFGNYEDLYRGLDDAEQQQLLALPPTGFDDDTATWSIVRAQTRWPSDMSGDRYGEEWGDSTAQHALGGGSA
jgi:hypothetical protein